MAFAGLELRYPRALDPHPNWTLGDALTDATRRSAPPTPLKQPPEWYLAASGGDMREKAFVMRVEEEDGSEEEDDNTDEDAHALVTTGARFPCNDLECSGFEDSGDEVDCSSAPYHLMEKRSLEKSILLVLELEHHLKIQEEVRSKLSSLELCHQNEIQRTISAFARLQKYAESRKEIDRRLDVQFQRKIAEVLDKHLSMVQRDHGQKSQIVERRIRDDAAVEEAKREQSMKEEKVNQERTRKEAEARQKAAGKLAAEAQKAAYEGAAILRVETVSTSSQISQNSVSHATMVNNIGVKSELPGIKVFADSIALEAELRRRALHDQVSSNIYLSKEYSQYGRQIGNSIGKLTPTTDSVKQDDFHSQESKYKGQNLWTVSLCLWLCNATSH
ncbi:unnamed protein product [Triticum turgidum subsp. durum]|uniref:Protein GLE1 n=1 Tax=Triticum turgidum subsp. durum TaxID=4567 RepID=A0A9R0UPT3_TRITD|nr:unnamed protein product [Triticum turgidum subsp. durum]